MNWPWRTSGNHLDPRACGTGRRGVGINVKWSCWSLFLLDLLEARRNTMQETLSSELTFSWNTQMIARGKITFWKWGLYTAHTYVYVTLVIFFVFGAQIPVGQGLLNHEVSRSYTMTHHSQYDSSGRTISSSQRPLPENTQKSQQSSMPLAGFEPTISGGEWPQTFALDRLATRIDLLLILLTYLLTY